MFSLTHWGRVTHICVNKLTTIGSDNGLLPGRRQAIIWNNVGILLIGHLGTNFSENQIKILTFSFKKIRLKMSSAKWWPFCLGLNVLSMAAQTGFTTHLTHPAVECTAELFYKIIGTWIGQSVYATDYISNGETWKKITKNVLLCMFYSMGMNHYHTETWITLLIFGIWCF